MKRSFCKQSLATKAFHLFSIFNEKLGDDHFLAYYFEHVVCIFLAKETSHQRLPHGMVSLSQQVLQSTNYRFQAT
jgi:hypothetical protein